MGHVDVGHRWDRVAMDLLDMTVTTPKDNRYVLVMVDCFFWIQLGSVRNLVVSLAGSAVGIQLQPDSPIILVHCQDLDGLMD